MILLVTPAAPDTTLGNGVTARRWADILSDLGHRVRIASSHQPGRYQALVALHAIRSADAVRRFRAERPDAPVVLALTGTDLYPDLASTGVDPSVLAAASRLVVLQPRGLDQLDPATRARTRVIVQSVPAIGPGLLAADRFDVVQLAHLRPVKDPLRVAAATRLLPASSRILVTHLGAARDDTLGERAAAESAANPRYRWAGPVPRAEALAVLSRARLMVLTSRHEGGANAICEALAAGVPIISSAVPGSVGLLGPDYPGYVPPGDTAALAGALDAAERDLAYYRSLTRHTAALRPIVAPERERAAWADLLDELRLPVHR